MLKYVWHSHTPPWGSMWMPHILNNMLVPADGLMAMSPSAGTSMLLAFPRKLIEFIQNETEMGTCMHGLCTHTRSMIHSVDCMDIYPNQLLHLPCSHLTVHTLAITRSHWPSQSLAVYKMLWTCTFTGWFIVKLILLVMHRGVSNLHIPVIITYVINFET